jgi:hypothetical protein
MKNRDVLAFERGIVTNPCNLDKFHEHAVKPSLKKVQEESWCALITLNPFNDQIELQT